MVESNSALRTTRQVFCFPSVVSNLFTLTHEYGVQLVSQSLRFISTVIRSGTYRDTIEAPDTVRGLIERVVAPNLALHTHHIDAFKDTSLKYVRAELYVSEVTTPRQAAADVIKALRGIGSGGRSGSPC